MEDKVINVNEEIKAEDTTDTVVTEDTETEETVAPTELVVGVVSGCKNLNIRKSPAVNDKNVLCIVPVGTVMEIINPEKATGEWYKVELENGDKGFCMKKFVTINE